LSTRFVRQNSGDVGDKVSTMERVPDMTSLIESIYSVCGKATRVFRRGPALRRGATLAALLAGTLTMGATNALAGSGAAPKPDGEATFKANCIVCHGEDGKGTDVGKSLNAPDLQSDAVQKQTDEMLAQAISEGKNNMPPFMSVLTKAEIQSLVVYVRTFAKKVK
jgi:mono/diheme cytochrome c family protein